MVITLFGDTIVRPGRERAEAKLASKLGDVLRQMPGFISFKTYVGEDGDELGVIRFETREQLEAWIHEGAHGAAQKVAHEYYQRFWVQTCETYREYLWSDEGRVEGDLTWLFVERPAAVA
jgi:antibiotic biosynthesis monooxygenase (ABM) superfamily enzyme